MPELMGRKPDFSGYVTKYNILCTDGRTIKPGAFKDDDGKTVPLVYMHNHNDITNVLGQMLLEHRDDGVYGYGFLNETEKGKTAKMIVDHGDISCLSIFANHLKQSGGDVLHGGIKEVSLVLTGANRKAVIDSRLAHGDGEDDEAFICMGDEDSGELDLNEDGLGFEEYLEHYGRKGMKWGKNLFKTEYEAHPREKAAEETPVSRRASKEIDDIMGDKKEPDKKVEEVPDESKKKKSTPVTGKTSDEIGNEALDEFKKSEWYGNGGPEVEMSHLLSNLNKAYGIGTVGAAPMYARKENEDFQDIPVPTNIQEEIGNILNRYYQNDFGKSSKEAYNYAFEQAKKDLEKQGYDSSFMDNYRPKSKIEKVTDKVKEVADETINAVKDKLKEIVNTPIISTKEGFKDTHTGETIAEWETKGDSIADLFDKAKEKVKGLFKHSELTDEQTESILMHYLADDISYDDILQQSEGLEDALTMSEDGSAYEYLTICHNLIDAENFITHAEDSGDKSVSEIWDNMSDDQRRAVYYLLTKIKVALKDDAAHSDEEDDSMKKNVFDESTEETQGKTLSHAEMVEFCGKVVADAKRLGSMKDAFLAHAGDYGIDNIEYLFPDAKNVTNTPIWIKRPDDWVNKVMNGVSHSPFSRIKSLFADITEVDARAKGYIKGNRKTEEVFGLLKRVTTPTTVYKKQKLDRDDVVDITDFDVVSWLKTEMRWMLNEELARAFLVGDGRSAASDDKINEGNIRPIWTDDDLFVIRKAIAVNSSTTTDQKCKEFIRTVIKARKDYRGSGNPSLYTTEDMLSDLLLMEDNMGHPLYDTEEKLRNKLRVKEIVTVPILEGLSRTVGSATMELMGILVNLSDYKVGADKGGAINMFDDFDIDYNQMKYLIETRCSGALTVPYSAIVIESSSSVYQEIDPDDPNETRYGKSVSDLQSDVLVNDDSISGTLNYVTGYTGFSADTELQSGHYLALKLNAPNGATTTIQMTGGGASGNVVTMDDDYVVCYIRSRNTKITFTTTLEGVSVSKTYSLRLLKLLSE